MFVFTITVMQQFLKKKKTPTNLPTHQPVWKVGGNWITHRKAIHRKKDPANVA